MPDGVTIRSKTAHRVGQQTKNAMIIFDPATWKPIQVFKMHERDGLPRESCPHVGYEDMRLFRTDKGGLQGIAASLHLKRDRAARASDSGVPQHQPPEQVLLSFDPSYNIVDAQPIRGETWSGTPQKNWVPFDHCAEPRFLYSIDKGTMFDDRGALRGDDATAYPSSSAPSLLPVFVPSPQASEAAAALPLQESAPEARREERRESRHDRGRRKPMVRGGDVRIVRSGRMKLDTMTSRPATRAPRTASRPAVRSDDSARLMGSGRILLPKYDGLRGGTQLVRVAEDSWLGIGHEMKFVGGKKYYWHVWYLVDSRGKMKAASTPMKLAPGGIEFAAGMAIDGDRVVVSFGVDDMECWIGETSLSHVMEVLRPVDR
jgi:hypothetical protein